MIDLEARVQRLARALSGRSNLQIIMKPGRFAGTDGHMMILPLISEKVEAEIERQWDARLAASKSDLSKWLADYFPKGKRVEAIIYGLADHETAHLVYTFDSNLTDGAAMKKRVAERAGVLEAKLTEEYGPESAKFFKGTTRKLLDLMANVCEDLRIEHLWVDRFPGAAPYLQAIAVWAHLMNLEESPVPETEEGADFSDSPPIFVPASGNLFHEVYNAALTNERVPHRYVVSGDLKSSISPKARELVEAYAEPTLDMDSYLDVLEGVVPICEAVLRDRYENKQTEEPEEEESEPSKDPGSEPGKGDPFEEGKEEEGKPEPEEEKPEEEEEKPGEEEEESEEEKPEESEEEKPEESEEEKPEESEEEKPEEVPAKPVELLLQDFLEEMDAIGENAAEAVAQGLNDAMDEAVVLIGRFETPPPDESRTDAEILRLYMPFTTEYDRTEPVPECDNPRRVGKFREKVNAVATAPLGRLLVADFRRRYLPSDEGERVNPRALASLGTDSPEMSRLFLHRAVKKDRKGVAVSLLIDLSGSMCDNVKIDMALVSAGAVSSILGRLRIAHEIVGFTTGHPMSSVLRARFAGEEGRRAFQMSEGYCRLDPLLLWEFKTFSEQADLALRRLAHETGLAAPYKCAENIDGESLLKVARRLQERREGRKVLIILSDGMPAFSMLTSYPFDPEERYEKGVARAASHLRAVARKIESTDKIELHALGIRTKRMATFYKSFKEIRDLKELPEALMTLLLKGGK